MMNAIVLGVLALAPAQDRCVLYMDPAAHADRELVPGSTVQVAVKVYLDGPPLTGAEFSVTYDPAVLSLVDATLGDFWMMPTIAFRNGEVASGRYELAAGQFDSDRSNFPAQGTYTVVTLSFTIVATGASEVAFGPPESGAAAGPLFYDFDVNPILPDPVTNGYVSNADLFDGALSNLVVPATVAIGSTVELSADVANRGLSAAAFAVEFSIGTRILGTAVVGELIPGTAATATLAWTVAEETPGARTVTARAVPLDGERDLADNALTAAIEITPHMAPPGNSSREGGASCSAAGRGGARLLLWAALAAALLVTRRRVARAGAR